MPKLKLSREWAADALLVSGAALASYGAWLVYPPAGFILGGVLLIAAGVLLALA